VPLPLAGLFEEATIERLAAIIRSIRGREQGADLGVLLPIQPNGSRPPLYCVHPSGGSVHYYFRFAHAFDDDQPVYGLQAAGLEGDGEPDTTIEAMAARYVAEIRRFQPDGPYRLLGWSLGGIVVFEMARQLRDLGERVDLAAVVDADAVSYEPPPSPDDLLLRMLLRADTEFAIDEAELAELDDDERLDRIVELARQAEVLPPLMPMARVLR
jgi:thioesterase domain-containing protein